MNPFRLSLACLGLALAAPAVAQNGPPVAQANADAGLTPAPWQGSYGAQPGPRTAARLVRSWQGTWVGPDGHPNSGYWPGDLLTPNGHVIGEAEFPNYEGTAYIIIHPDTSPNADWYGSWLDDCHNKLNYSGYPADYVKLDICASWLRHYRQAGLAYSGYGYAVPVTLARSARREEYAARPCCRTITREVIVTKVIRVPRWYPQPRYQHTAHAHPHDKRIRLHDKRIALHDKRIRLKR